MTQHRAIALGIGFLAVVAGNACDAPGANPNGPTNIPGVDKFIPAPPPGFVRRMSVNGYTLFLGPTGGAPKPGLTWANGTGATPATYAGILERVAFYGVQVVASNSSQTGNGAAVAQGVDVLMGAGLNVTNRFCAAGHSQGGSGAVNATRLNPNIICTIPVQADTRLTARANGRDMRGPALVLCGANDLTAPCGPANSTTNGSGLYNQAVVPVVQLTVAGSGHIGTGSPTGRGALYAALVTAQTQAVLVGDPQARAAMLGNNAPILNGASIVQVKRAKNF